MAEPFVSEIRMMTCNYAPKGWATCNGQILPIAQNQALFALIATLYGGDGQTTFALPNLQGRTPIHFGKSPSPNSASYSVGQIGGEAAHTLTIAEIPPHNHSVMASPNTGSGESPAGTYLAQASQLYGSFANPATLAPATVANTGGQPHQNMQPYLVITFCIALQGVFPFRS